MAQLFPDEAKRLKLGGPGIWRAEMMASIAESQGIVDNRSQVIFGRARLDRHKKLAATILSDVLRRTRPPLILVAPLLQEIDAGSGRRDQLVGKVEARLLRAGYCILLWRAPIMMTPEEEAADEMATLELSELIEQANARNPDLPQSPVATPETKQ